MRRTYLPIFLTGLIIIGISCSNSKVVTPIIPEQPAHNSETLWLTQEGRAPFGAFYLRIGEDGQYETGILREAIIHFDVTDFVMPPACPDCFWVVLTGLYGDIWEFDLYLKNPTFITGYDVRGTIYDSGPIDIINPDSYTKCLAPDNDKNPVNPFFIFNSGIGNNQWGPGTQGSAHAIIKKPPGVGWAEIQFLVDASFPGNQKDPLKIRNLKATPFEIYDDGSDSCTLSCKVDDWQMDVYDVTADLSPIGGLTNAAFSWDGSKFVLPDVSFIPGAGVPGVYDLLIAATSGNGVTYNYLRLTVKEAGVSEEPSEWTVLVYLHAADLPDVEDINEMEMSGSITGELNIIVLWDKPWESEEDVILRVLHDPNPYDGTDLTLISQVVNDYGAVIPPSKQLDMGDGETLRKFLAWGMDKYHAQHYLLVLWDHGSGIFGQAEKPPLYREVCNGLNLWEIRDAMQDALDSQTLVEKIDIVGFDVCVLGEIETAYQLKDLADYVVASEANEPGPGWDYGPPLVSLKDNIHTQTAEEFAYNIVESYRDSYDEDPAPYHYSADTTQAASSTQKLVDVLIPELNLLADELIAIIVDEKDLIAQCRDNSLNFWDPAFPDLGHFVWLLTQESSLPQSLKDKALDVLNVLDETMVLHTHTGTDYFNEFGYRIWLPDNIDGDYYEDQYINPEYLNFQETNWDEFLYAYGNPQQPVKLVVEQVVVDDSSGGDSDGYLESDETAYLAIKLRNDGYMPANMLNCWLQEDDDYIEVMDDFSPCDDIPAGESRWLTNDYLVSVYVDCPENYTYAFNIYITAEGDNVYNSPFNLHSYPVEILIIDYDQNNNSAPYIAAAFDELGLGYDYITEDDNLPPMLDYDTILLCLGMYDFEDPNHVLTDEEGQTIEAFLNAGGSAYIEGGDCWYWDILWGAYDIATPFGIKGLDDGWYDELGVIEGAAGSSFENFYFSYIGDNSYPDYLATLTGSGSTTAMSNQFPPFDCMIAYDSGTYRTIGASFEFGGLYESTSPNTHTEFLQAILDFLGGG